MTVEERNKAVVLRFLELVTQRGQEAAVAELVTADYTVRRQAFATLLEAGRDAPSPGRALLDAVPDRVDRIEEIIAEGDTVWALWTIQGTHRGNLFGIPPTGRRIEVLELGIFRLVDGKIASIWALGDELGLLKQLGARWPSIGG